MDLKGGVWLKRIKGVLRMNVGNPCGTIISLNKTTSPLSCMSLACVQISRYNSIETYIQGHLVGVDILEQLKIECPAVGSV
jgi:hypothetical protein